MQLDPPFQAKCNPGAQYRDLTDSARLLFFFYFSPLNTLSTLQRRSENALREITMAASDSVSKPIRAGYTAPTEFGPPIARRRSSSQAALDAAIMMAEDVTSRSSGPLPGLCLSLRPVSNRVASRAPNALVRTRFSHSPRVPGVLVAALLIINRRDGLYGPLQAQGS